MDTIWLLELEDALKDCSVNEIAAICRGKNIPECVRSKVWQVCLSGELQKGNQLLGFNEIFDLPYQNHIRQEIKKAVENLGNDEQDKIAVEYSLESIITFYCKNRQLKFESSNGWIELLLPLLSLKLKTSETYNLFESIRDNYIPKGHMKMNENVFHVFRLLLLYHDPTISAILETKRIIPEMYTKTWFQSLFAATCTLPVVLAIWDLYFQHTDPFLVFFLSLIMLINRREQIIAMRDENRDIIIDFLATMPNELESEDVIDFCSLAQFYSSKTPSSFKTDLLKTLFGYHTEVDDSNTVSQVLCLPVSVSELIENSSLENASDGVRFFLVDCRPADQYNWGHLTTAFHLDCNLMLQEPVAFQTAVQGLLKAQRSAIEANSNAGGEHLCFVGSGRLEEDQYTHMVVAYFLQKGTQYVSILTGGFTSIHEYFGDTMLDCLEDHDPINCRVCNNGIVFGHPSTSNTRSIIRSERKTTEAPKQSFDLFSKISSAMKTKTSEVKGKLIDLVNPLTTSAQQEIIEKHVSISEKNERKMKRYRNVAPVFGIDEDEQQDNNQIVDDDSDASKEVVIQKFLKNPDIIKSFQCQEVHMNGLMFDSYVIISAKSIFVLRETGKKGLANMIVKRPLSSIVKITAKKRHKDLITFKYGVPDGDNLIITDMDRFLIPNASEATQIISQHILNAL